MEVELELAKAVLARTPVVLDSLLRDLPDSWTRQNEGPDTWSPYDVVGHLIHGDLADWIQRARFILEHGTDGSFEKSDLSAVFEATKGKSMNQLLDDFASLRGQNLNALDELRLTQDQLTLEGGHPAFGTVTLGQILSTWVVHDLGHIRQAVRAMAKGYASEVGPFAPYLRVLGK